MLALLALERASRLGEPPFCQHIAIGGIDELGRSGAQFAQESVAFCLDGNRYAGGDGGIHDSLLSRWLHHNVILCDNQDDEAHRIGGSESSDPRAVVLFGAVDNSLDWRTWYDGEC